MMVWLYSTMDVLKSWSVFFDFAFFMIDIQIKQYLRSFSAAFECVIIVSNLMSGFYYITA